MPCLASGSVAEESCLNCCESVDLVLAVAHGCRVILIGQARKSLGALRGLGELRSKRRHKRFGMLLQRIGHALDVFEALHLVAKCKDAGRAADQASRLSFFCADVEGGSETSVAIGIG